MHKLFTQQMFIYKNVNIIITVDSWKLNYLSHNVYLLIEANAFLRETRESREQN